MSQRAQRQSTGPRFAPATLAGPADQRVGAESDNARRRSRPAKERAPRVACVQCHQSNSTCSGTSPKCGECSGKNLDCSYPKCGNCQAKNLDCTSRQPCSSCTKWRRQATCQYIGYAPLHPCFVQQNPPSPAHTPVTQAQEDMLMDPQLDAMQVSNGGAGGPSMAETSALVFLPRAWHTMALAFRKIKVPGPDPSTADQLLLPTGDLPFGERQLMVPPDVSPWLQLQEQYFHGWSGSHVFLHEPTARTWLHQVYDNYMAGIDLSTGLGFCRTAIVFFTMALGSLCDDGDGNDPERPNGWIWSQATADQLYLQGEEWISLHPGPAQLDAIQARLLQTMFLMQTHRTGIAWYVFGAVRQMVMILGLHRRRGRNRGMLFVVDHGQVRDETRTFWAAYILEQRFAMMSGWTNMFHRDGVDQLLPDSIPDEDELCPFQNQQPLCSSGVLLMHARMAQIMDSIARDVYSLDDELPEFERLNAAIRCAQEVEIWNSQLFQKTPHWADSSPSPVFRRQAILLELAHCHAVMLVYRPFLTTMDPMHRVAVRKEIVPFAVAKCIAAARVSLEIVDKLVTESANTRTQFDNLIDVHAIVYCAVALVWVLPLFRDRQQQSGDGLLGHIEQDTALARLASRVANNLAALTNWHSTARRWVIILNELREETRRQVVSHVSWLPRAAEIDLPGDDPTLDGGGHGLGREVEDSVLSFIEDSSIKTEESSVQAPEAADAQTEQRLRSWDNWKIMDWADLDSAAFAPISEFRSLPSSSSPDEM